MSGLHVTVTTASGFTTDLILFTTSLLITLLLLVLALRAARLPGTPVANILFAVCGILWSAGGLAQVGFIAAGLARTDPWTLAAQALQYSGAAAFPIAMLAVWRPFAALPWQKTAGRALQICATISAAIIAILLWSAIGGWVSMSVAHRATQYNASVLLAVGAAFILRRDSTPRAVYLPSLVIVVALCAAIVLTLGQHVGVWLWGIAAHLILLMVLGTFLLFARFRYADLFIRYSVRIMLAAVWAGVMASLTTAHSPLRMAHDSPAPELLHAFLLLMTANAMLFSFTFVDERIGKLVNRWLFHAPDYRLESKSLGNKLRDLHDEREIEATVEDAARRPLELSEARMVPLDPVSISQWPAGVLDGETVERGVDLLIPVASGGRFTHLLVASPGPARPSLVSRDVQYLRGIAAQFGNRLDALGREREAVERQSREALLLQQVTEAELRALRAQINPHFLFNSLNTVADLIVRDPVRAEAMTLRLASVFRHVLAHSSRPLTTIRDEMEFVRTYLYIEEARFGDRLQVQIDVDQAVAADQVPSLILQPLVENALKHGLGPKPGPGHLWISAHAQAGQLRLCVEDDGMGLTSRRDAQGVGLTNVAERLATLYQDRAGLTLEAREGGGCRVTLLIPRSQAVSE
jgi:two-component system, LytTR family, sensor kinase